MSYPVKNNWKPGQRVKTISANWLSWLSNFVNETIWRGMTFTPTSSGRRCIVKIKTDDATLELTADNYTLQIKDAGVDTAQLADSAVETAKINNLAVTTGKIANDAVTADKLANTAVSAGSYTAADITVDAQGRITAASNGEIGTSEIANNAVTSGKMDSGLYSGTHVVVPTTTLYVTNGVITNIGT